MRKIPLSLYIHLPWCVKKCPYCDFNSHDIKNNVPEDDYITALISDLRMQQKQVQDREVISIFLGGGTPSIFSSKNIKRLMDQENFSGFRNAGTNRISIGAQSFTDSQLQHLGRIHNSQAAVESVEVAKQAGFENINLDLMYALPEQNIACALHDIEQALALQPTHISYYQLTIEPNTSFYRQPPRLPNTQTSWNIQQAGIKKLAEHGYAQYEVSAYAQNELQCLHNTNYWQFGDYLGIGAGAHQKLSYPSERKVVRSEKPKHPQQYMKAMNESNPDVDSHTLSQQDLIFEFMLNALRLKKGFTEQQFTSNTGLKISQISEKIDMQVEQGLLAKHQVDQIRLYRVRFVTYCCSKILLFIK